MFKTFVSLLSGHPVPKHKASHPIGLEISSEPLRKRKNPQFTFHKTRALLKMHCFTDFPSVNHEALWRRPHVTPGLRASLCLSCSGNPCCYLLDCAPIIHEPWVLGAILTCSKLFFTETIWLMNCALCNDPETISYFFFVVDNFVSCWDM
jgi:hypothetical protein